MPSLPTISMPTISLPFDLPRLELPHVELPRFEMPTFARPDVDLPSFEQVTGWARDAALAGVGLATVTAERVRVLPGRIAEVATTAASSVADRVRAAV